MYDPGGKSEPAGPMPPSVHSPLRLQPDLAQLPNLVEFIEDFCLRHDLGPADTNAFTLAAEELFANTIHHSQPLANSVEFSLVINEQTITAVYSDDAAPFDPTALPEVDTTRPLDQRTIGGLGVHFIRRTMPTFLYQRRDGRNVITFGRPLTPTKT